MARRLTIREWIAARSILSVVAAAVIVGCETAVTTPSPTEPLPEVDPNWSRTVVTVKVDNVKVEQGIAYQNFDIPSITDHSIVTVYADLATNGDVWLRYRTKRLLRQRSAFVSTDVVSPRHRARHEAVVQQQVSAQDRGGVASTAASITLT